MTAKTPGKSLDVPVISRLREYNARRPPRVGSARQPSNLEAMKVLQMADRLLPQPARAVYSRDVSGRPGA